MIRQLPQLFIFLISLLFSTLAAYGHEFWIEPQEYQVETGDNLVATLQGGQKFEGTEFSFVPPRFQRFDLVNGAQVIAVEGRAGDRPALNMSVPGPGLWVVVHETKDNLLTWKEWEKFTGFVEHKKLGNTLQQHADRGLPQIGFRETYRRFVKSLIGVGSAQGADRPMGLRTEFVALANPYTDDLAGEFPVQLLFEGAPRAGAQIEVFEKDPEGNIRIFTRMSDDQGRALIPVVKGRIYLLDAVKMLPLNADDPMVQPSWHSLWAALTFSVPD